MIITKSIRKIGKISALYIDLIWWRQYLVFVDIVSLAGYENWVRPVASLKDNTSRVSTCNMKGEGTAAEWTLHTGPQFSPPRCLHHLVAIHTFLKKKKSLNKTIYPISLQNTYNLSDRFQLIKTLISSTSFYVVGSYFKISSSLQDAEDLISIHTHYMSIPL